VSAKQNPFTPRGSAAVCRLTCLVLPRWIPALAALLAVLALLPVAPSPATAATIGPRTFYLALGDSLAWGYQPDGQFFAGYSADLYLHLLKLGSFFDHLQGQGTLIDVNMSCPGETTTTFLTGGCPYASFHKYPYAGPQMTAALSFIRQHPGQVSPVTIDLGADDFLPLIDPSTCAAAATDAFTQTLATFDANFSRILSDLRSALNGRGDLVAMTYYFPYQNQCPNLVPYAVLFNQHLAADAQQNGVPVADIFGAFGGATVPNPNLCTYTWICSSYHDVHATTQGYAVIANALDAALGY
jgi:lysophospholipase L1-like esterase